MTDVFVVIADYRTCGLGVVGVYHTIESAKEGFLDDLYLVDGDVDDKTATAYVNELFSKCPNSLDAVNGAFYVFETTTFTK